MDTVCAHTLADFKNSLQRMDNAIVPRHRIALLFWVAEINLKMLSLAKKNRLALTKLREHNEKCAFSCPQGNCMGETYDSVAAIRDDLKFLSTLLDQLPLLWFIRRRLIDAVDEWDDLAEESLVGGDQTIRQQLAAIAARL